MIFGFFLIGSLVISIVWFATSYHKDWSVDLTRQQLFELRDQLFDRAIKEDVNFDDTAYGMVRTLLNGMIRFAHELSFMRVAWILISQKVFGVEDSVDRYQAALEKILTSLPEAQRQIYKTALEQMHEIMFRHLLRTSFTLFYVFQFLSVFDGLRSLAKAAAKKAGEHNEWWARVDCEAASITGHALAA